MEYTTYFTEYTGHADRIAAHIAEQSSVGGTSCTLSVVGGDGTLNEVINGLVKRIFPILPWAIFLLVPEMILQEVLDFPPKFLPV